MSRPTAHVIKEVSSCAVGRNRLTLQSICRPDGVRALRPVWERRSDDGWEVMNGFPEFASRYWVDVISKAASEGLLGSESYKQLVVNLARGLDSSKNPTPKAYVELKGKMIVRLTKRDLTEQPRIDEVAIYQSFARRGRDVSAFRESVVAEGSTEKSYKLTFEVSEQVHFTEALGRLRDDLRQKAIEKSFEAVLSRHNDEAFCDLFNASEALDAGFSDPSSLNISYTINVY